MLRLLKSPRFALLWWAGLISIMGDWTLRIALPVYVLALTGSPAATAGVIVASVLPALLIGPLAGVYVDRWDRRRTMIVTNVLQGAALIPLSAVHSSSDLWLLYGVTAVESALAQFFLPAENALLPRLVAAEHLASANSLNTLNNNIARLVGPAVGGLAAATLGLSGVAWLNAGTFLAAAGLIALIPGRYRAESSGERHLGRELVEGLQTTVRSRIALAAAVVVGIGSIGEGVMGSTFVIFVDRGLNGGAPAMGALMSAQAVGGVLGGLAGAALGSRFNLHRLTTLCLVSFGLVDIVIFNYPRLSAVLWPELLLFVVVGVPSAVGNAALMTLFQGAVPDRQLGRVFAVILLIQSLATLGGAGLAAALTDRLGVLNLLTVQGLGYVVAGLLFGALTRTSVLVKAPARLPAEVTSGDHAL